MHDLREMVLAELAVRTPLEFFVVCAGAGILARLAADVAIGLTWRHGFRAGRLSRDFSDRGAVSPDDSEATAPEPEA